MLPPAETIEQFHDLDLRDPAFAHAAREILSRLNKPVTTTTFPSNGSLPVVFADDVAAIKFFPPVFRDAFETETKALNFLPQRTVPKLLNSGGFENWQYVLMSRLSGHSLKDLWASLSPEQQQSACHEIGKSLRQIHDMNLSSEFDLDSWTRFLSTQKQACFARHEMLGLSEELLKQIPSFLESVSLSWPRVSFLHTEVMRDHVFFENSDGQITFQGFIDFEPSMVGAAEYDFASVAVFVSSGDRKALRSFFEGYGNLDQALNHDFRRRIMAYTLLHKYSNLKWYLQFMPNAGSLDALADLWWAV